MLSRMFGASKTKVWISWSSFGWRLPSKTTKAETFALCLTRHLILLLRRTFFFFFVVNCFLYAKQIFKYVTWLRYYLKFLVQPLESTCWSARTKSKIDTENNIKLMIPVPKAEKKRFTLALLLRSLKRWETEMARSAIRNKWKRKLIDVQLDKRNCG